MVTADVLNIAEAVVKVSAAVVSIAFVGAFLLLLFAGLFHR